MTEPWLDGDKGWRVETDDLADLTLASQKICKDMGIPFDPSSVLVFADYEGHVRLSIRGIHWKYDEDKGIFEAAKKLMTPNL